MTKQAYPISKIYTHERLHFDEILAILLLITFGRKFGRKLFPDIEKAEVVFINNPDSLNGELLLAQGILCVGIGRHIFDEHDRVERTCAAKLVAEYLGLMDNDLVATLVRYTVERDRSTGTKQWELPQLIKVWNRRFPNSPSKVLAWGSTLVKAQLRYDNAKLEKLDMITWVDRMFEYLLRSKFGQKGDKPTIQKDNPSLTLAALKRYRLHKIRAAQKFAEYINALSKQGLNDHELPVLLGMWLTIESSDIVQDVALEMVEAVLDDGIEFDRVWNETIVQPVALSINGQTVRYQIFHSDSPHTQVVGRLKYVEMDGQKTHNDIIVVRSNTGNVAIFKDDKAFDGRLTLDVVIGILRRLEALKRNISLPVSEQINLCTPGNYPLVPQWYYLVGTEEDGTITGETLLNGSDQAARGKEPTVLSDEDIMAALAMGLRLRL
jgi:hypothetical protein